MQCKHNTRHKNEWGWPSFPCKLLLYNYTICYVLGGKSSLSSCSEDMEKNEIWETVKYVILFVDKVFFLEVFNLWSDVFQTILRRNCEPLRRVLSVSLMLRKQVNRKNEPEINIVAWQWVCIYFNFYLANSITIIFFIKYYVPHMLAFFSIFQSFSLINVKQLSYAKAWNLFRLVFQMPVATPDI